MATLSKPGLEELQMFKGDDDGTPSAEPTNPCRASMSARDSICLLTACAAFVFVRSRIIDSFHTAGLHLVCSIASAFLATWLNPLLSQKGGMVPDHRLSL